MITVETVKIAVKDGCQEGRRLVVTQWKVQEYGYKYKKNKYNNV
jgi:hypothetical protein